MDVQIDHDSMLVVADTHYPGWQATIDGKPTEIFRANIAFRAVFVPAGSKTIRFDYQPWWLLPGALVSVVSILITLLLFRSKNPDRE